MHHTASRLLVSTGGRASPEADTTAKPCAPPPYVDAPAFPSSEFGACSRLLRPAVCDPVMGDAGKLYVAVFCPPPHPLPLTILTPLGPSTYDTTHHAIIGATVGVVVVIFRVVS